MRPFFKPSSYTPWPVDPEIMCDEPDCELPGLYKAPKSRENLREYRHFCLEHVREYNKKWDYFKDADEDAIYAHMRETVIGERPTWPTHKANFEQKLRQAANFWGAGLDMNGTKKLEEPVIKTPVRDAFSALGLAFDVDFTKVKQQFRSLVKKYHPDTRPDDPKATERFQRITAAYITLKEYFAGPKN